MSEYSAAQTIGEPSDIQILVEKECLYYYDGPLIMLAEVDGRLHYGHMVVPEADREIWMLAPIDEETAEAIRRNRATLRGVLTKPGDVLVAIKTYEDGAWSARRVQGSDLPDGWLPEAGHTLSPR